MNIIKSEKSSASYSHNVMAFHCSGGAPHQWKLLATHLSSDCHFQALSHKGNELNSVWTGIRAFTLADEAEQSLQLIDNSDALFHLVGHSYGGAVALHIALARPDRIASIALYEPCAFHLLRQLGSIASAEMREIQQLSHYVIKQITNGNYEAAMSRFVDYWNGSGAWVSLKTEHQAAFLQWAPTAAYEFEALVNEETPIHAYQQLNIPVRLLQGGLSPAPVKTISNALIGLLPNCQIYRLGELDHMGPIKHADYVARLIAAHVNNCMVTSEPSVNDSKTSVETVSKKLLAHAA